MTAELRPRVTHICSVLAISEGDGFSREPVGSEHAKQKRRNAREYYDVQVNKKTSNSPQYHSICYFTYYPPVPTVMDPPSFACRTRKWSGLSRAMGDQSNRHRTFLWRARHRVVCQLSAWLRLWMWICREIRM